MGMGAGRGAELMQTIFTTVIVVRYHVPRYRTISILHFLVVIFVLLNINHKLKFTALSKTHRINVTLRQKQPRKMLQLTKLFPVLFLAICSSSFGYNDLSEFACLNKTKVRYSVLDWHLKTFDLSPH